MDRLLRLKRLKATLEGLEGLKAEPQTSTTLERFIALTVCMMDEVRGLLRDEGITSSLETYGEPVVAEPESEDVA